MMTDLLRGHWRLELAQGWTAAEDHHEPTLRLDANNNGALRLGELRADIDYRIVARDRRAGLEFSWVGTREGTQAPLAGRGWAVLEGTDTLRGELFVHRGDSYTFLAHRLFEG